MLENSTVLVVDDSASTRRLLSSMLKKSLYCNEVLLAKDGTEALEHIQGDVRIDWIFSDLEMPVLNGEKFLEKVRGHPDVLTSEIPFFIITSHNDIESLTRLVKKGVTDIMIKPVSAKALEEKIARILSRRERRNNRRRETNDEVKVRLPGSKEFSASLANISLSGCLFRTTILKTSSLSIYDDLRLSLFIGDEKILLRGKVARLERGERGGVGGNKSIITAVDFEGVDPENRNRLKKFVSMYSDEFEDIHLDGSEIY